MQRKSFLQFPRAAEGLHLEEAYRHGCIVSLLNDMFYRWGYLPVETPAFDFFDTYRPLLHGKDLERVYRLIDREGDLLMLRSDITLFLAKQVGIALREKDLPVRACYSSLVLRHQNEEDISSNEFFQIGAELIGRPGLEGDLEALLLVLETLKILDIPAQVHLGSRAFYDALSAGMDGKTRDALGRAVLSRERNTMENLLGGRIPADLFLFIGTTAEYTSLMASPSIKSIPEAAKRELEHLASLAEVLESLGAAEAIRIDLSEIGSQPYHTGIVFQGYMEHIDSAFLSGGRYDHLLSRFGLSAASIGFSFFLRKIEPFIGRPERFAPPEAPCKAEGSDFAERYRNARDLRRQGKRVVL